jgi:nitroreductase
MLQNKKAITSYPIMSLIAERWSPRAFENRPLEDEKIMSIFEAGRWSASSMNDQPWRFVYAKSLNNEHFAKLFDTLTDGNKLWVKNVPLLIACFYKKTYFSVNRENRNAKFDLGLAVQNMTIQALNLEIFVHPMGGFDVAKLKLNLNISEDFEPVIILAAGYLGNPDILPEDVKIKELATRTRKKLDEIAFEGKATF